MRPKFIAPNSLWLLLPPLALCALDFGLTLHGQSDEYWAGNYAAVNELSPSFAYYLSLHPLVFAAAGLLWMAIFSTITLLLPERLALTVAIAIVIGHMWGALTWIVYRFGLYQGANALFLLVATLIVFTFKKGQNSDGSSAFNWRATGLPEWARWLVIAALAVIPIWWFLIPR